MTQEDKAKAYDELIKDIKRIIFNHEGGKLYNLLEKKDELNQLEPRFNIGDVICDKSCTTLNKDRQPNLEIIEIKDGKYYCYNGVGIILLDICQQNCYELVSKKVKQKPEGKSAVEAINEKKDEKQLNPYSGVSFKYKGHTWGMCARDNGVDILLDSQLIKHFKYNSLSDKQGKQTPINKIQLNKRYKCIEVPRYSTFIRGHIYRPEDEYLCTLMSLCSDCFELENDDTEQKPEGKSALEAINEEKVDNANKVEPKFKIGDWIINKVNNSVYQIIGYENNTYRIRKPDCVYYELLSVIDETYRLWHITDAKDGDIIVTGFGNIFIFKGIRDYTIFDYCGLYYGKININATHVNESCATDFPTNYTPAVKEQRDLLMKALNDAGYDFDFEKKELKKLNTNKKVILHPFDKVLVRNTTDDKWEAELIINLSTANKYYYRCIVSNYKMCVPYNKDTADLLNTSDNSPIDYKIKFSKEFKE